MRLTILSHKPCWRGPRSPSGYATDGGFPFQVAALSALFDETRLLVPVSAAGPSAGEVPLTGERLSVVPLTARRGQGLLSKLGFGSWLLRNSGVLLRELVKAEAVHAPIPGDVGTIGMLGAFFLHRPLWVRHCGNWSRPATAAERFWRWFMESTAGGRNLMLATGGNSEPPSRKNPQVHWIFSTSLTRGELDRCGQARVYPTDGKLRLVMTARQEPAKGAGTVIRSLPRLLTRFPQLTFEVIGQGSALPEFQSTAQALGVADRVVFSGKLTHAQVLDRLQSATLFVFPTTASDGFPKAVLEGLASGLPVVATRVSVLPQLLGNGCGILLASATPEAVADGVAAALSQPARYEAMSREAIATARQYSLENWRDEIGCHLRRAWGPLRGIENDLREPGRSGAASAALEKP